MSQRASATSEVATYENLIASTQGLKTRTVTIKESAALVAGSVLGKRTASTATSSSVTGTGNGTLGSVTCGLKAKPGVYTLACTATSTNYGAATSAAFSGNTGDGAMGSVTTSAGAKVGAYKLVIIEPGSNAGKFTLTDPDGLVVGTGTVGSAFSAGGLAFTLADGATDFVSGDGFTITVAASATDTTSTFSVKDPDGNSLPAAVTSVAYTNPQINFTIADGATNFAVGDSFTITVAGDGKYKLAAAASVDGSQTATAILAEDADASAGDAEAVIYEAGDFLADNLTYGSGHTAASVRADLRAVGITI